MIKLTGESLTIPLLVKVARFHEPVSIDKNAMKVVQKSRSVVENMVKHGQTVYGVNTGFGKLSNERIDPEELSDLQKNLLMSHACGTGDVLDEAVVRGMMLLRVNALIKGFSGIRLEVVQLLVKFLNHGITPVVYAQGSLGASGDLVPLAHMALPLINEGEVFYKQKRYRTRQGLKEANIKPLERLEAKEGLALINGTQAMTSIGALTLYDAYQTLVHASVASGMSFEALKGIIDVFDPRIHEVRPHKGQRKIAALMNRVLKDSKNVSHQGDDHVQDAYSLRCVPQVHGASLDTFDYVRGVLETEMNAATDNPLIFHDTKQGLSAGNFHGQPVALVMDFLKIAIAEIANISERRLERLVNKDLNDRFPPFLAKEKGRNSGFMIVQYVAASLVSENKVLCHPASVDSIPSSGNQEDHVSMGTIAARHASQVLKHTRKVVGLEMFTAAQALDFEGLHKCGPLTRSFYNRIRDHVPFIEEDTWMQPYMDQVETLLIEDKMSFEVLEGMIWKDVFA